MKIVKPYEWTTLVLDESTHLPTNCITAKAAFYHMLKGHGLGYDANWMPYDFEGMRKRQIAIFPDHPVMRSAPNHLTGEEVIWPIPTIFVPNFKFFYGKKAWKEDNLPPLKKVYDFYRGVCQRCLKPIKRLSEASRDHWKPKKLGGGNGLVNIVLMHRECNSIEGHNFPKYDVEGNEIKPKLVVFPSHFVLPPEIPMRDEWRKPMCLEA